MDTFVLKHSAQLSFAENDELIIQKIKGSTIATEARKVNHLLVALLVFAENLNLPFRGYDQSRSWGTFKSVGVLRLVTSLYTSNDRSLVCHISWTAIQTALEGYQTAIRK